jgi:dTDP-4-dehydrorhamnose reductase
MILVFGKYGQLSRSLQEVDSSTGSMHFLSRAEVNFLEPHKVKDFLQRQKPTLIINASAYTDVDKAESEREEADLINHQSVRQIATYCAKHNVPLIHFSTDFVFDGSRKTPWSENSLTHPINYYGSSKLAGEKAICEINPPHIILRTSWVYSDTGDNFVLRLLEWARTKEILKIVDDQVGHPTWSYDLAVATQTFVNAGKCSQLPELNGIYHLAGKGAVSRFELAQEVVQIARDFGAPLLVKDIQAVSSSEFKTPALRPKNSRLSQEKIKQAFNLELPFWKDSLRKCIQRIYADK